MTPLQLSLVQWKNNFFIPIQNENSKLAGAILRLIEQQRDGQGIDQGLVKKLLDSFVSLGLNKADISETCLDMYEEHFEIPFLETTERYYTLKSEAFLAENSVSEYLKKAEEWLREEEGRVEGYLNTVTRKPLIDRCERVLIREHFNLIQETFRNSLNCDENEDLRIIYVLLARIPDGLEPLRDRFEEHVKRAGLVAITRLVGDGGGTTQIDPKAYVDALYEVYRGGFEMVERSFEGDTDFVARLDKACRDFVNENAATRGSSTKSSDLMVKYADDFLRKNRTCEEGLESALSRAVCASPCSFSI